MAHKAFRRFVSFLFLLISFLKIATSLGRVWFKSNYFLFLFFQHRYNRKTIYIILYIYIFVYSRFRKRNKKFCLFLKRNPAPRFGVRFISKKKFRFLKKKLIFKNAVVSRVCCPSKISFLKLKKKFCDLIVILRYLVSEQRR